MPKAIRFTLPTKFIVQVIHDDGHIEYHFEPSETRTRMKQSEIAGYVEETADLAKLLPQKFLVVDDGTKITKGITKK